MHSFTMSLSPLVLLCRCYWTNSVPVVKCESQGRQMLAALLHHRSAFVSLSESQSMFSSSFSWHHPTATPATSVCILLLTYQCTLQTDAAQGFAFVQYADTRTHHLWTDASIGAVNKVWVIQFISWRVSCWKSNRPNFARYLHSALSPVQKYFWHHRVVPVWG